MIDTDKVIYKLALKYMVFPFIVFMLIFIIAGVSIIYLNQ